MEILPSSEKSAVVLDIGAAYTKCGFAGDHSPKSILSSEVLQSNGQVLKLRECTTPQERRSFYHDFLRVIYFRHLLVNPSERRVVVCESLLTPTADRDALASVLFEEFKVPSLLLAPSHLVAALTLAVPTALVLDAGYVESFVLPIYEGVPLVNAWQARSLAAEAIHRNLHELLLESGRVILEGASSDGGGGGHYGTEAVPLSALGGTIAESVFEDIKVRACFVTTQERAQRLSRVRVQEHGVEVREFTQAPEPVPSVEYPLDGRRRLLVSGRVREEACEILFELDSEEKSLATLLLDALVESPVDARRALAENVVLVGGTAMLPGLRPRLAAELRTLLRLPYYEHRLPATTAFKFHRLPVQENCASWLGASIFGSTEALVNWSVALQQYKHSGKMPDWPNKNAAAACSVAQQQLPAARSS